jgi:hypothetical protein
MDASFRAQKLFENMQRAVKPGVHRQKYYRSSGLLWTRLERSDGLHEKPH